MKREDVVELRRQHCQREWNEKARKQQQPTEQLNREEERSKVGWLTIAPKNCNASGLVGWRLMNKIEKSIQPKDRKHKAQ